MVLNVLLGLVLIPRFGAAGAAGAFTVGSMSMLIIAAAYCGGLVGINRRMFVASILKIILAAVLMGLAVWVLRDTLSIAGLITVGVSVYGCAVMLFGEITKKEIVTVFKAFFVFK